MIRIPRSVSLTGAGVAVSTVAALLAGVALASASSTVSFYFSPGAAPKSTFHAGAMNLHTKTALSGKTATQRLQFNFDNDFRFSPGTVPTCNPSSLAGDDLAGAIATCGSAQIGSGTAQFKIGSTVYDACALAFNGTKSSGGLPRVLLFFRVLTSDCTTPASNHTGSITIVLYGVLRTSSAGPDYGKQLDFNNIDQVTNGAARLSRLDLTIAKGNYVAARCFDTDRTWNLRTRFAYVRPFTSQTVNSMQPCEVVG